MTEQVILTKEKQQRKDKLLEILKVIIRVREGKSSNADTAVRA